MKETEMNHFNTLLALAGFATALGGAAAQAQPVGFDPWMIEAVSMKSRDEVLAELRQARADGSIRATAADYDFAAASPAVKSRAQVMRELQEARATGEFAAANAEAHLFGRAPQPLVAGR
jgi:hypothetical protein